MSNLEALSLYLFNQWILVYSYG